MPRKNNWEKASLLTHKKYNFRLDHSIEVQQEIINYYKLLTGLLHPTYDEIKNEAMFSEEY